MVANSQGLPPIEDNKMKIKTTIAAIVSTALLVGETPASSSTYTAQAEARNIVKELKKSLPRRVDDDIVLTAIEYKNTNIKKTYSLSVDRKDARSTVLSLRNGWTVFVCGDEGMRFLINKGITNSYYYFLDSGEYIGSFTVSLRNC
jgi:hypothetical protein